MSRSCLLLVLCAAAAVLGCGARQHGRAPARDHVTVRIVGNASIDADLLRGGLSTARERGAAFDRYLATHDADRIRGVYLRRGYFGAEVATSIEERADGVIVTYRVHEGPRARLARVEIDGAPDAPEVSADELRDLVPLADGAPFDYERYDEAKPKLVAALHEAGYAHARIDARVRADVVRDQAVITIDVDAGPRAVFGPVELRGVTGPLADAVRARVEVHPGDRYSVSALSETSTQLYALRRFGAVKVDADRSQRAAVVPVTITVEEGQRHELRLGGGVGLDPATVDVHGRAGYRVAGWPTPLTTASAELRPALAMRRDTRELDPRIEALVGLERLDLVVPRLTGELEASFAYLAIEAYTSVGPRLRLGLRRPLASQRSQLAVGWQLRGLVFRDVDPAIDDATAASLGLDEPYRLGYYEQSLVIDRRDEAVAPRRGVYGELRLEEGTIAAGGEFTYLRATPELRGYLPIGPVVVAARGRVGAIIGDVPVTQRYYAGGASSHRGFAERRLSPTATSIVDGEERSVVIGGAALIESSAEVRFPIGTIRDYEIGGVAFLDGGDVTARWADLDPTYLHWAAGGGLRFATAVGPVRLDVGYRLDRTGPGEPAAGDRFAYHLSFGEAF